MIRLIAIDLDGTLLNQAKQISARNQAAIQAAKAQGVKIVLCTGRPLAAIHNYLDCLNLNEAGDYSITFNGGLVQKNATGEIVAKASLAFEDLEILHQLAQTLNVPLDILSEGTVLQLPTAEEYPSIYQQLNGLLHFEPQAFDKLSAERLYNKAVVAIEQSYLDQQIAKIPAEFYEKFEIIKTRSNLLEFMPKGVTKAFGLSLLGQELGISAAEMMALGDEENDLSMIRYVGTGVAMENAVPLVKEHAQVITASNEADGVAQAIEELVLHPVEGGN